MRPALRNIPLQLIIIALCSFLLCGCGSDFFGGSSGGSTDDGILRAFYPMLDSDALSEKYTAASVGTAIEVPFNKALDVASIRAKTDAGLPYILLAEDFHGIRVYEKDTLQAVAGKLYVDSSGTTLIFVPDQILKPDQCYQVLVSADIRSSEDEFLGEDLVFEVCTSAEDAAISILTDKDVIIQGDVVGFSFQAGIEINSVLWNFNTAEKDADTSTETDPEYGYPAPGAYDVSLTATDRFNRSHAATRQILVFKDIASALSEIPNILDIDKLSPELLGEDTLEALLKRFGGAFISAVEADINTQMKTAARGADVERIALSEVLPQKPLLALNIRPESIEAFAQQYVQDLIAEERFLGIVSFKGFPAILSFIPYRDYYVLEILVNEGDVSILHKDEIFDIDLQMDGISPTPGLYRISVPISEAVFLNLQNNLNKTIRRPLSVLYTRDGYYMLDTYEVPEPKTADRNLSAARWWGISLSVNLGIIEVSASVGDSGIGVDVDVDDALLDIYDFLTGGIVDLLTGIKDFIDKAIEINPFDYLSDVKSKCAQVKDQFTGLYNTFKNPSDIVSDKTDPAVLAEDIRKFLYENAGSSVKTVAEEIVNAINATGSVFKTISDPLLGVGDASAFLSGFIPNVSSDAHVVFHVGTDGLSFSVKIGNVSQSISLDMLNALNDYADTVLDALGADFPLSDILSKLNLVQSAYDAGMAGEVGYYYAGSSRQLKFVDKILFNGQNLYLLQVILSSSGSWFELKVSNPLDANTYVSLRYDPVFDAPAESVVGAMFQALSLAASPLPNISLTFQTKYRDILMQITSRLRPAYSFSTYIDLGMEVNYYVAIGGKGEVGIQLYMGIDGSSLTPELLTDLAKDAFEASKDSFSEYFSTKTDENGTHGVMSFPDEAEFIDFMYAFMTHLKTAMQADESLSGLLSAVTVGISPSAELGVGLGAGGTGTGGGSADISLGTALDMNASLLFFHDIFLNYCRNNAISTFILAPLMDALRSVQETDRSNPFDVKSIIKLFEDSFTQILEQSPTGTLSETDKYNLINSFFNQVATQMNFGLSFQTGINAELEEAADIEAGMAFGPTIGVNGEYILNALYPIVQKVLLKNSAPQSLLDRLKVLDQPGVFPEVSFAFPLSGCIETGFDEGIQVNVGVGAQMNFIEGTVALQGDPFRSAAYGGIAGTKTLKTYPVVLVDASPTQAVRGQSVAFTADVALEPLTSITQSVWIIDGQPVAGIGDIWVDDEKVAQVTARSNTSLTAAFTHIGVHQIRCEATDSKSRTDFGRMSFPVLNQAPAQPVLTLTYGEELYRTDRIPVQSTDADSDALAFEVLIASDSGFSTNVYSYTVSGTQINLPYGLVDGNTYYIKVRAFDGYDYSLWSAVGNFKIIPAPVVLLSPANGASFTYIPELIQFTWHDDSDYFQYRFLISDDPDFSNIIIDEFTSISLYELFDAPLEGLLPDIYYWRVAGYQIVGNAIDWGETWSFTIKPPPTELEAPANSAYFAQDQIITLETAQIPEAEFYEFQISLASNFSSTFSQHISEQNIWQAGALPPNRYYWRARTLANGIAGDWTAARTFYVRPDAPDYISPEDKALVNAANLFIELKPVSGASQYTCEVSQSDQFDSGDDLFFSDSINTLLIKGALAEGETYFWRAKVAVNGIESLWGKTFSFTVKPHAPALLDPADKAQISHTQPVSFKLEEIAGAPASYEIWASIYEDFSAIETSYKGDKCNWEVGVMPMGEYFWKARAAIGEIWSDWSPTRSFRVVNLPPSIVSLTDHQEDACINGRVDLNYQAADPDGDPITYIIRLMDASDNEIASYETDKTTYSFDIADGGYEFYVSIQARDSLGAEGETWKPDNALQVVTENCPPPQPAVIGPKDGFVAPRDSVTLELQEVSDPDGDPIDHYTFEIMFEDESKQSFDMATASLGLSGLKKGKYIWRAKAVSRCDEKNQESPYTEDRQFSIEGNIAPATENLLPEPASIFNTTDEITLAIKVDNPEDEPLTYDFEYDRLGDAAMPQQALNQSADTLNIGQLLAGVYQWRGRASDPAGDGDWSSPTCFTVIDGVAAPNIADAGNSDEFYANSSDQVSLTFYALVDTVDCTQQPVTGRLEYQVSDSASFPDARNESFQNGVSFELNLTPGTYYWHARHILAGLVSDWSPPLSFTVIHENLPPVCENQTPAPGAFFTTQDAVILEVQADDPEDDPILSYDFQYDSDPGFSAPTTESNVLSDAGDPSNTVNLGQLAAGEYYWRARASDAQGTGDWSDATCFTVVESLDAPNIADAGNSADYTADDSGNVTLTFKAITSTVNCMDESVGALQYQIADNDFFGDALNGTFENNKPFTLPLPPGTYYWRARIAVDSVESAWSSALSFEVTEFSAIEYPIDDDFEAGINDWTQVSGGVGDFLLEMATDGDSHVFHYKRYNAGSSGGEAGIQQNPAIDITGYAEVYIEFDVKLIGYSLSDSGWWSFNNGGIGEWPANVSIYFTDQSDANHIWNNGFLSGTDALGRTNYTPNIGYAWHHYKSPNLRTVVTTETTSGNVPVPSGLIKTINAVRIGGGGWNFEGEFDNVKLTLIP